MKLSSLLLWITFSTTASALGLRQAWEKMFLYLVFRMDQQNPEANQVMGFQCGPGLETTVNGRKFCRELTPQEVAEGKQQYEFCTYTDRNSNVARKCFGLLEFTSQTDGVKHTQNIVQQGTDDASRARAPLDLNNFDIYSAVQRMEALGANTRRYQPCRVMKLTPGAPIDFDVFLRQAGDVARNFITSTGTLDGHPEIEKARSAVDEIIKERESDHSPNLVTHLREHFSRTVLFAYEDLGPDVNGKPRSKFSAARTVTLNRLYYFTDVTDELERLTQDFYHPVTGDRLAREHFVVIQSLRNVQNRISAISCGV